MYDAFSTRNGFSSNVKTHVSGYIISGTMLRQVVMGKANWQCIVFQIIIHCVGAKCIEGLMVLDITGQ